MALPAVIVAAAPLAINLARQAALMFGEKIVSDLMSRVTNGTLTDDLKSGKLLQDAKAGLKMIADKPLETGFEVVQSALGYKLADKFGVGKLATFASSIALNTFNNDSKEPERTQQASMRMGV